MSTRFGSGPGDQRADLRPSLSPDPQSARIGPDSAGDGREALDPVRTAQVRTAQEPAGLVWRRRAAGPRVLLVGFAVAVSAEVAELLRVPGPPASPAGLLLGVVPGAVSSPWSLAGDPAVTLGLVSGLVTDPLDVSRAFPFVVRGWPQQWGRSLDGLVPDRLPRPLLLAV